ncbi:hypothetical protein M9H77_11107 [Catharanthus roseus]|uniref:Uncharacterized protein n=1 Tax=Catharanthus roseus TaxID=4058 RepID=A0ACC0BDP9_CATRO|nr:hypothetical protein M9H77_11107 [Catharanthus roseus]
MANRQFFTTSCLIIPSYKPHFFAWKIRLIQDTLVDSMISSPFERVTFYETVQVNAKAAEIHQRLEHFQYSYFELSLDVMEHYKIYPKPGHKKKLPPPSKLRPFLFRTSKEARILTIDQAGETSCPTFAFLLLFNHSLDLLFLHSYTPLKKKKITKRPLNYYKITFWSFFFFLGKTASVTPKHCNRSWLAEKKRKQARSCGEVDLASPESLSLGISSTGASLPSIKEIATFFSSPFAKLIGDQLLILKSTLVYWPSVSMGSFLLAGKESQ